MRDRQAEMEAKRERARLMREFDFWVDAFLAILGSGIEIPVANAAVEADTALEVYQERHKLLRSQMPSRPRS